MAYLQVVVRVSHVSHNDGGQVVSVLFVVGVGGGAGPPDLGQFPFDLCPGVPPPLASPCHPPGGRRGGGGTVAA